MIRIGTGAAGAKVSAAFCVIAKDRMTYQQRAELSERDREVENNDSHGNQPALIDLVKVLAAHPGGLRRWSVMRAIRNARVRAGRDIPQKLEDEVERTFRRFCADPKAGACPTEDALFYRPRDKAGEVWAAYPERVKDLLAGNDNA